MDQGPAPIRRQAREKELDRTATVMHQAFLDLARLLGDVDVDRPPLAFRPGQDLGHLV